MSRGGGRGVLSQNVLILSKQVLMPGAPPTPPVDRRKDRHGKNITLATCLIRMR